MPPNDYPALKKIMMLYRTRKRTQHGFSLIELLVALAINLVIVTAAAYLYLGTSDAKRALDQQQALNENGQYALDIIGRDVMNAGFFPAVRSSNTAQTTATAIIKGSFKNPVVAVTAYKSGIFGCSAQKFDLTNRVCASHTSATVTADTVVINYFTNDTMGSDVGQQRDCTRAGVTGAGENAGRSSGTAGQVPITPLFISNSYTLATTTFSIENQNISTLSLTCGGNGGGIYQPSIAGIENLQFRYGVFTDATTLQPSRFYLASEMAALGNVAVDGVDKDAWGRVVSVEVCLVARALQQTKTTSSTGAVTPYVNCSGTSVTPADRSIRRVYRKIFALRNNLTQIIVPSN